MENKKPLLVAKDISISFGALKAVDNFNLEINSGELIGLIGPNGAGKTTVFNILTGVYNASSGEYTLDGENIIKTSTFTLVKKGLARTFQNIQLFKFMTVRENVKIGFHTRTKSGIMDAIFHSKRFKEDEKFVEEQVALVLEKVGLSDYADTMAGNLSYGIQRKVEIARALALNPEILLLDEPAAGMNPNETESLREFIIALNKSGYTIVVIEHDMKFIMNSCNRILVLNFGEKICEGGPKEVQENKMVQEAYFGHGKLMGDM